MKHTKASSFLPNLMIGIRSLTFCAHSHTLQSHINTSSVWVDLHLIRYYHKVSVHIHIFPHTHTHTHTHTHINTSYLGGSLYWTTGHTCVSGQACTHTHTYTLALSLYTCILIIPCVQQERGLRPTKRERGRERERKRKREREK